MANLYFPPPPNTMNNISALRLWLYRLYRYFTGQAEYSLSFESRHIPTFLYYVYAAEGEAGIKITFTLPDSSTCKGKRFAFSRSNAGLSSDIAVVTGDTIDGGTTSIVISDYTTPHTYSTMVISTGNGWDLI